MINARLVELFEPSTPFVIKTAATTQVKTGTGLLDKLTCQGGTLGNVTVYDAAAAKGLLSGGSLAIGTTKPRIATGAFSFVIATATYDKAAVAAGTALTAETVPQNLFGAVALDIGADGTIDCVVPATNGNTTGYATAALATAALPAVAADHVRIGSATVSSSEAGGFVIGTTNLDAANTTVEYTSAAVTIAELLSILTPAQGQVLAENIALRFGLRIITAAATVLTGGTK